MPFRFAALAVVLLASTSATAQQRTLPDDDWCKNSSEWGHERERACEVRETMVPASRLDINGGPNGGIKVKTWDRSDILVRSRVSAVADTEADARSFVRDTEVTVTDGRVRADIPETRDDGWVNVNFEVFVPRETDLELRALNGGVAVEGVEGDIEAEAMNGGITLSGVAGAVRARTMNGGVSVALAGDAWEGRGLDVETTNGGISVALPEGYSAELEARTRVGRISTDGLSLPRESERRGYQVGDRVEATLGRGGAPLRLRTTNGGVSIQQGR